MTGPIIDRDAIIEKAARVAWDTGSPLSLKRWDELSEDVRAHSVEREYAADMLPSIADDLLAPIEALHPEATIIEFASPSCEHGGCEHGVDELTGDLECPTYPRKVCARCSSDYDWTPWPCPTAQAVAAIREAVRA